MIRHNSREISNVMAELQTNVKQGAVIGGWVCFGVGTAFMFLSLWALIFYAPLFLAALVLSIVAMSQRRVAGGLTLLLCCMTIPPLTFLGLLAYPSQSRSWATSSSPSATFEDPPLAGAGVKSDGGPGLADACFDDHTVARLYQIGQAREHPNR